MSSNKGTPGDGGAAGMDKRSAFMHCSLTIAPRGRGAHRAPPTRCECETNGCRRGQGSQRPTYYKTRYVRQSILAAGGKLKCAFDLPVSTRSNYFNIPLWPTETICSVNDWGRHAKLCGWAKSAAHSPLSVSFSTQTNK